MYFKPIESTDNIKDIIKSAFKTTLDISGFWGYSFDKATILYSHNNFTKEQLEFTLMSMRANIEMNMTLSDDDRYAGINPTELHRETIIKNNITYEKVKYKIIAIKEKPYKRLMKEYKEKYGQNDFNIATHFEERNKNSIEIESIYWFNITNLN